MILNESITHGFHPLVINSILHCRLIFSSAPFLFLFSFSPFFPFTFKSLPLFPCSPLPHFLSFSFIIRQSMAWLLHESRLQGEIPMFCIVGIRPLLCNNRTTISVSVGAIKLLTHLHSRLEVSACDTRLIQNSFFPPIFYFELYRNQ